MKYEKNIIIAICIVVVAGGIILLSQKNNGQLASQEGVSMQEEVQFQNEIKTQEETKTGAKGIDDICNYFPKELIEQAIDRPIVKVEGPFFSDYKTCTYYTDWKEDFGGDRPGGPNIVVAIDEENVEDIKADLEQRGYKLGTDSRIQWEHYTVRGTDFDNEVWLVGLVWGPEKVLRVKFNHGAASGEELVKIVVKLAKKIINKNNS